MSIIIDSLKASQANLVGRKLVLSFMKLFLGKAIFLFFHLFWNKVQIFIKESLVKFVIIFQIVSNYFIFKLNH